MDGFDSFYASDIHEGTTCGKFNLGDQPNNNDTDNHNPFTIPENDVDLIPWIQNPNGRSTSSVQQPFEYSLSIDQPAVPIPVSDIFSPVNVEIDVNPQFFTISEPTRELVTQPQSAPVPVVVVKQERDVDVDEVTASTSGVPCLMVEHPKRKQTGTKHKTTNRTRAKPRKDSEQYRIRRFKNNIAVKKSREKTKLKNEETEKRVDDLRRENELLNIKVGELQQTVKTLQSLAPAAAASVQLQQQPGVQGQSSTASRGLQTELQGPAFIVTTTTTQAYNNQLQ